MNKQETQPLLLVREPRRTAGYTSRYSNVGKLVRSYLNGVQVILLRGMKLTEIFFTFLIGNTPLFD